MLADAEIALYQPPSALLRGRVIAVTGAGDGVGRAVAVAAAGLGAEIILIGRTVKRLEAVEAEIAALAPAAPAASIAPLDLEKALAGDYDRLAAALLERYARLDGLVHCAAILGALAPIEHADMRNWCRVLHVNLTAAFVLTQTLMPLLRASRDASLVFTSSAVGRRGRAYWGAYSISKFAVEGFTQVLAHELEGTSTVRVNVIDPGKVRTSMRRQAYPSEVAESLPTAESLTAAYVALLGPASRGVTGQRFQAQEA